MAVVWNVQLLLELLRHAVAVAVAVLGGRVAWQTLGGLARLGGTVDAPLLEEAWRCESAMIRITDAEGGMTRPCARRNVSRRRETRTITLPPGTRLGRIEIAALGRRARGLDPVLARPFALRRRIARPTGLAARTLRPLRRGLLVPNGLERLMTRLLMRPVGALVLRRRLLRAARVRADRGLDGAEAADGASHEAHVAAGRVGIGGGRVRDCGFRVRVQARHPCALGFLLGPLDGAGEVAALGHAVLGKPAGGAGRGVVLAKSALGGVLWCGGEGIAVVVWVLAAGIAKTCAAGGVLVWEPLRVCVCVGQAGPVVGSVGRAGCTSDS